MVLIDLGLDNRKLALIIWAVFIFVIICSNKKFGSSVVQVLKAISHPKLLLVFLAALAYSVFVIWGLTRISFWHLSMLGDSVFWFLGAGVIFIMNTQDLSDTTKFKRRLNEYVSFTVLLGFFVNLYNFNLLTEMILLPLVSVLAMLVVVSEKKQEFRKVSIFLNGFISVIGVMFLLWSIFQLIKNIPTTNALALAESIILTPVLTLLFLPFIYFLGVYSMYDTVFCSISHLFRNSTNEISKVKQTAFKECGLNYWALLRFRKNLYLRFTSNSSSTN